MRAANGHVDLRIRLLAFCIWLITTLLLATVRFRITNAHIGHNQTPKKANMYAFWHGRQLALFKAHRERPLAVLTSLSPDGQLQAAICSRFGIQVARGSSSRQGLSGILALTKMLKQNISIGLAVDGPKGPVYQAKSGIMALARVSQSGVIPVGVGYSRCWELSRAWDRFQIPKPFATVHVTYGAPIFVDRNADRRQITQATDLLTERLRSLTQQTDQQSSTHQG